MERATRRVAWTSAVIHGLVHASVLLLPAVLGDLARAYRVSLLDLLAVANVMYAAFGLAAVPAGYFADRVGSRRMLLIAAVGCATGLAIAGFAPSFPVLAVGLVLIGVSAGVYHPSGFSMISRGVSSGERGRAIGIHGLGGNLGEALAPAWAAWFAAHSGWRAGFLAAAGLALGAAALGLTLPAAPPSDARQRHRHSAETFSATLVAFASTARSFWSSRRLRWLLLAMVASGFVYRGVITLLPLHLASVGAGVGSYVTSAVLLSGLFAQWFGGALADRLPREHLFLAEVTLFVPALGLLGLGSGLGLVAAALSFGFLWYLAQPVANALTAAYAETRHHGLVYGVQSAATFGVGSFATTVGGLLMSAGGSGLAFLGFSAVALVQVVAALALVYAVRAPAAVETT